MKYQIIEPQQALRNYVKYYWYIQVDEENYHQYLLKTFVDDSSGIIIQHNNGNAAVYSNQLMQPVAMVYGQINKPSISQAISGFEALGILFHPFALSTLFKTKATEFTNQIYPLEEVISTDLLWKFIDTEDLQAKIKLTEDFLIKQLFDGNNHKIQLIQHCLRYIKHQQGTCTVKELTSKYNISERQLQRIFENTIGVHPRYYLKIIRFNHVISMLQNQVHRNLSEIAYDAGYYDQSHFIRQVKELSGFTPKELVQINKLPINLHYSLNNSP